MKGGFYAHHHQPADGGKKEIMVKHPYEVLIMIVDVQWKLPFSVWQAESN